MSTTIKTNPIITVLAATFNTAQQEINAKHSQLGGDLGLLGVPLDAMRGTPDSSGFFRKYRNGMIYWSPATRANEVHGAILGKWSALGFERSFLGYPLTDETGVLDGVGRFNRFQRGLILWTPQTGAHEVHGAILDKWSSLGFERSFLGYPVSDELNLRVADGRFNNFQRGQIAWSPRSGAAVTSSSFRSVGGGIRPQGVPGDGIPEVRRRVVLSAHMDITDDETFGSNEHGSADHTTEGFLTNKTPQTPLHLVGKAGGEVRIELDLNANPTTEGDVQIKGAANLFEGTSEENDDLNGTTDINFAVPRDEIMSQSITVRNTAEGGDFANIRLTVSNFAA